MDKRRAAETILKLVGGADNVEEVTHCFTRLRFVLKDESIPRDEEVSRAEGVISVVRAGGQYQVVCGTKVQGIYQELEEMLREKRSRGAAPTPPRRPIGDRILQKVAEIFTPLIPAIAASGLIKGLLTAARLLLERYGIDLAATDTYVILNAASQVIFYFMPIFLAMTCAKAFRCNRVMAMVVGASLVYPQMDALIQNTEQATTVFGLPVLKNAWQIGSSVKVFSYTESVIPIILAILCMAALERWLTRLIPEIVRLIAVPGLDCL